MIKLTKRLRKEYETLYRSCEIRPQRFAEVDKLVDGLLANRERYETVADAFDAPWYFVAAIHNMESGQRFSRHLHNGDPLTRRTTHVPAGRPRRGSPPFTWEESAIDALRMRSLQRIEKWSLPRLLYELERYNGWGYRRYHPHVKSPYLWAGSIHYSSGKYVADGTWSETAVSRQTGAAVLIRRLQERQAISLPDAPRDDKPLLHYADSRIPHGEELQRFLNDFPGIALRVDGWPGQRTSDAVQRIFGFRLKGDPRDQE